MRRAGRQGDPARRRRGRGRDQPGRARELRENVARLGAANVERRRGGRARAPARAERFDHALVDAPCSGLGVLARRPDLRWRAEPLPELQLALLRAAAERVSARRHDRLLGLHDQRRRERGRRRACRPRDRAPRRGVAAVPRIRGGRSSCSRSRTCTGRAASSSRACALRRITAWAGTTGSAPSRSSRRCTPPTSRGSAIRSRRCCRAGVRIFHFDVGDGHFVPPITMGPVVLRGIAPIGRRHGRTLRLPPDGRQPRRGTSPSCANRARTASPSTTRSAGATCRGSRRSRASSTSASASPSTRSRSPRTWRRRRRPRAPTSSSA